MISRDISFCFHSIRSYQKIVSLGCIFAKDSIATSSDSFSLEDLRLGNLWIRLIEAMMDNLKYRLGRNTNECADSVLLSTLVDDYVYYTE
jgi:hypothetical protein